MLQRPAGGVNRRIGSGFMRGDAGEEILDGDSAHLLAGLQSRSDAGVGEGEWNHASGSGGGHHHPSVDEISVDDDRVSIGKALEGICVRDTPQSLFHGLALQGLGSMQQRTLALVGLISCLGSTVTFVSLYVEGTIPCDGSTPAGPAGWWTPGAKWEFAAARRGSIADEWGLVCGEEWKLAMVKSLYFAGAFVGVTGGGVMSDALGRRYTLLFMWTLTSFAFLASAFAPNWIVYAALRFVLGVTCNAAYLIGFALAMEWVPAGWRTCVGTGFHALSFASGEILLSALAVLLLNWRSFLVLVSVPQWVLLAMTLTILPESPRWLLSKVFLALLACFVAGWRGCILALSVALWASLALLRDNLPESPAWLLTKGNVSDANALVHQAYALDHLELKFTGLEADTGEEDPEEESTVAENSAPRASAAPQDPLIKALKKVSTYTMVLMWFTAALVYYGLTLSAGSLAGNFYVNACVSAFTEMPASIVACILLERPELGRRRSTFSFYLVGGVCCLASVGVPPFAARWLVMVGKLSLTAAFDTIYQYSSELFPTAIRSRAMGICSAGARTGSVVAPQVVVLGEMLKMQPSMMYGLCSVVTAVLCIATLPETGIKKPPAEQGKVTRVGMQQTLNQDP